MPVGAHEFLMRPFSRGSSEGVEVDRGESRVTKWLPAYDTLSSDIDTCEAKERTYTLCPSYSLRAVVLTFRTFSFYI